MIFYDSQGRQFNIKMDIPALKRIREATGFNFSTVTSEDGAEKIKEDMVLSAEIVTAVIAPQLEQMAIDADDYLKQMLFHDVDKGMTAVLESYVDFMPEKERDIFKKAISKTKDKIEEKRSEFDKKIEDGEVDKMIDDAVEELFE